MTAMLTMLALGGVSWLMRMVFIVVIPADRLPARFNESLKFLAPAVLAATAAVELTGLMRDGSAGVCLSLAAGTVVVVLVAHWTRSLNTVVLLGLVIVAAIDLVP